MPDFVGKCDSGTIGGHAASSPYDCIARPRELWFERLEFGISHDLAGIPLKVRHQTVRQGADRGCFAAQAGRRGDVFSNGSASDMKMSKGRIGRRLLGFAVACGALAMSPVASAELGQPAPWEYSLQGSATEVMDFIRAFHNGLLVVITLITLFVLALLITVMVKFNARSNPVPSRTTHNTLIEVAWTLIPVVILVGIAIPSFRLLFLELDVPKADLTIKAIGKQWYWTYAYPDNGKFEFDSLLACDESRTKCEMPRLLSVDNEVVVPVNKVVRVQTIGADVIHSFAVPAFGIKIDAIPGRLNETWFRANTTGKFYGQCSELCGKDHAYMPIAIKVVTDQEFATWVEAAKKKFASAKTDTFAQAEGGGRPAE
jgi:cytochrome c oxidase subunit 2